ncbi:hypothetical protein KCP78_05385 [Salmonella enterica subsp. enterica]|nr:hypothetical protein KCP78_05385 [Salmonella enterica subsp. enterica]
MKTSVLLPDASSIVRWRERHLPSVFTGLSFAQQILLTVVTIMTLPSDPLAPDCLTPPSAVEKRFIVYFLRVRQLGVIHTRHAIY